MVMEECERIGAPYALLVGDDVVSPEDNIRRPSRSIFNFGFEGNEAGRLAAEHLRVDT